MKRIVVMLFFGLIFLSVFSQKKIEQLEKVFKEKDLYYMFVEPVEKKERWYKLFVQFNAKGVVNTGHANTINTNGQRNAENWQVLNDTLYFLTITKSFDVNYLMITGYMQYSLDTVFSIIFSDDKTMNRATRFQGYTIPSHTYQYQADRFNWLIKLHSWSDIVHTQGEFTIFASISDTILVIKDIPPTFSFENREYTTRSQTYTFPYLGKFNVFKIKDGYYILNDIGEFYHLQDSIAQKIGYLEYEAVQQVFCLKDNDADSLSFNCKFVALFPEYNNLVGYIDKKHWLSKKYFEIKKQYTEELHKLNRSVWK